MLLLLALGLTLLWRFLEWYGDRLDLASQGAGSRTSVPTTLMAPAPAVRQTLPPLSPPPPGPPDERQPAVISAGEGVAFLVARNLYATSESLTDGYGKIYPLNFPGALTSGKVTVHDRSGSGIALFSTDADYLPLVAPILLEGAANLRPGERVRALYPLFRDQARPAPGALAGLRLQGGLVLLDTTLHGTVRPGAPILDHAGRAVGIVVRRRDQDEDLLVAADHILELLRRARLDRQ